MSALLRGTSHNMISYRQGSGLRGLSSTSRTQWRQKPVGLALALASITPCLSLDVELPSHWCSRLSNFNTSCLEVNSKGKKNCCATLLSISATATCNLVTEDTMLMHSDIFCISLCECFLNMGIDTIWVTDLDHHKMNLISTGTGSGLLRFVLKHIPAHGMWVLTMVRLAANNYTPVTSLRPTSTGNPFLQAWEVARAHHLYEHKFLCSFS